MTKLVTIEVIKTYIFSRLQWRKLVFLATFGAMTFQLIVPGALTVSAHGNIALNASDYSLMAMVSPHMVLAGQTEETLDFPLQDNAFFGANSAPVSVNVQPAVAKTIVKSKTQILADIVDDEVAVKQRMKVTVTAYSSTPDQTDDTPFISANGTRVYDGMAACNFLPFGAKVRLPDYSGDKIYTVEDRMAKRNSHKIDIWMETHDAAMQFGVRNLTVEILE